MRYQIVGTFAQSALMEFDRGDAVWLSNGAIMSHSRHVRWRLRVPAGVSGAVRRSLSGEGISLTYAEASQPGQHLRVAADAPGHLVAWDLADGAVLTTRGSFLAAWGDIDITVTVARRAGAALFGGVGLFLQRVSGSGVVLIHGSGDLIEASLEAGEARLVSTGNLAAFSDETDYGIEPVGGVRKFLFGNEGLFMTKLTGPGVIYLQSLRRESKARG